MKSLRVFFITIFILINASCYYNSAERNKIKFKDNASDVQNALLKMEVLINKLPASEFNTNYEIKNGVIEINGGPREGDSTSYYTKQGLSVFETTERKQFISLAKYLERNYITAGYLNYKSTVCFFTYRDDPDNTFDDLREIAFLKDVSGDVIKSECKILDRKDQLLLLAPVDAKIYNNFTLVDDEKSK
ncbi:hypothetical protein FFF34_005425 [Inquilinus sp. KBS0705]|nr:hypothetical protein FFF34_005425 [Inquilinus sp. KBS0705]